jgi:hypothetical protein
LDEKVAAPVYTTEYTAVAIRCADHVTPLYTQKLSLTSPTSGGRSVDIQGGPYSIRQFFIINNQSIQWQLPSIDNKRYFPIFSCVVGLIGY